jgi:hypothetical protein
MRGDDFVDTVWLPTRVMLGAIDFIAESGNRYAIDSMLKNH